MNRFARQSCSSESRTVSSDDVADRLVRSALDVVRFWESNVLAGELEDLGSTNVSGGDNAGSDDLDRVGSGAMTAGHLHVHLGDGSAKRHVSVLLVHVNGTSTGEVTEDNTVVSDGTGLLLVDLAGGDDLTLNLTDLVLSLHEVPELRSGENGVSSENTHSVESGIGNLSGSEGSSDNEELSQLQKKSNIRHMNE